MIPVGSGRLAANAAGAPVSGIDGGVIRDNGAERPTIATVPVEVQIGRCAVHDVRVGECCCPASS